MSYISVPLLKFQHLKISEGSTEPEARSGHRVVVFRGNLYSIGGYNPNFWGVDNDDETYYPLFRELWKFNLATKKWTELKCNGYMPKELASHAALLHGSNLLVLGGTGVPFGETSSNQLYVCNLNTLTWKHIQCTGKLPTPSYGHAMLIVPDELYVFGGTSGWEYNADLHRLDLRRYNWELVEFDSDAPEGRYRHELCFYNQRLFVLGGGRSYLSFKFQKISSFNFTTSQWEKQNCLPDHKKGYPRARRCHGCVQLNNAAYICGGYNGETIFGDIWRLHLDRMQWELLPSVMPEPAYFHSMALGESGRLLVFGGVTAIDTKRTSNVYSIWLQVPTLKELCWQYITELFSQLDSLPQSQLLEYGIPMDLIDRLFS